MRKIRNWSLRSPFDHEYSTSNDSAHQAEEEFIINLQGLALGSIFWVSKQTLTLKPIEKNDIFFNWIFDNSIHKILVKTWWN